MVVMMMMMVNSKDKDGHDNEAGVREMLFKLDSIANRISSSNSGDGDTVGGGDGGTHREPDPDAIKMFVGQIPREWSELECHNLLAEFGDISSINILKDKKTGVSRGCCFVTYYTRRAALEAQNALHDVRILPGMHHPIQMKPADSENRNERKLFIGMLSKKYTEVEVRKLFSSFGTIEECTILRDSSGQSKGCAFVTFSSRSSAVAAIKTMNHSQTLEGCSSPVVVKFADTQKEKDARKNQQQLVQQLWAAVAAPTIAAPGHSPTSWSVKDSSSPITDTIITNPYVALVVAAAAAQQQQKQQQQQQQQQQQFAAAAATLALQQQFAASNQDHLTLTAATLASNPVLAAAALCGSAANGATTCLPSPTLNGNNGLTGISLVQHSFPSRSSSIQSLSSLQSQASPVTGSTLNQATKQMEGPEGSNLFIYHLPADYTDTDLAQTFTSFGNVISSKVFIDKNTNLSKCFGFVSFDNPISAQAAIQAMNGFQIGNKRLKVQLKRIKEKPY